MHRCTNGGGGRHTTHVHGGARGGPCGVRARNGRDRLCGADGHWRGREAAPRHDGRLCRVYGLQVPVHCPTPAGLRAVPSLLPVHSATPSPPPLPSAARSKDEKQRATSRKVYKNERHVPMWYCGYEGEQMREAFRVCSGITDIGCWPSERYRERWMALTSFLQHLCDQCLSILLEKEIRVRRAGSGRRRGAVQPFPVPCVRPLAWGLPDVECRGGACSRTRA